MRRFKGTIPVNNIFPLLYYAYFAEDNLELTELEDAESGDYEDARDLFAEMLIKGIGKQLKQGLYREYLNRVEDITALRGKIDMRGTIRDEIAQRQLLSCEYDELSENTLGNQILKTTVMLLIRDGNVREEHKDALRREILYFSNVDEIYDPTSIPWTRVRYHRNNLGYRELLFVCQLILKGMLMSEDGEYKLESFVNEERMAWLYEKFVLGYYQKEFSGKLDAYVSTIKWAGVDYAKLWDSPVNILPEMRTDIMLSYRNKEQNYDKVLIIDTKWYQNIIKNGRHGAHKLDVGNLYQIISYVQNKDKDKKLLEDHTVSGMLLYAGTDEEIQPNASYPILGHRIDVKTLDLGKEFKGEQGCVRDQLDGIIRDFFPEISFEKV